MKNKYDMNY